MLIVAALSTTQRPLLLDGILSPAASRRVYARSLEVTDVCCVLFVVSLEVHVSYSIFLE